MHTSNSWMSDDRIVRSARRRRAKAYRETAVFVALFVVVGGLAASFDLFEALVDMTRAWEGYELDELFASLITTSVLAVAYCGRRMVDLRQAIGEVEEIDRQRARDWSRLCDGIEAIDTGFALWDHQDRLVLCNARYRTMFPEAAELLTPGAHFADVLATYYRKLQEVFPDRPLTDQFQARLRTHEAGGSAVFQDPLGRWLRSDDRRTEDGGTVSLRSDVTVVKQREIDLERAAVHAEHQAQDLGMLAEQLSEALKTAQTLRVEAEAANVAKSNFLATMSHELRTPLNAIIGFSDIIKNRAFGDAWVEKYYSYAEDIHNSGTHLLNIINQILDLSKIESGNVKLNVRRLDFLSVLSECCELIGHEIQSKRLRLHRGGAEVGGEIWADEGSLKQILFNVLSNAIKYTPEDGEIRVATRDLGRGAREIAIVDSGIGIPEKEIDRLIRPFERMDAGYTSSVGGSGLGLAIVHSLVEAHGGTVRIDSTPGLGTAVTLSFPSPEGADAAASSAAPTLAERRRDTGRAAVIPLSEARSARTISAGAAQ